MGFIAFRQMLYQGIDIESESQQYTLVSSVAVFSQWSHRELCFSSNCWDGWPIIILEFLLRTFLWFSYN